MKNKDLNVKAVETVATGCTIYQCPDMDENGVICPEPTRIPINAEHITWLQAPGKNGQTWIAVKGFSKVEQKKYVERGIKNLDNIIMELALEGKLLGIGDGVTYSVKSPEEIFDAVVA